MGSKDKASPTVAWGGKAAERQADDATVQEKRSPEKQAPKEQAPKEQVRPRAEQTAAEPRASRRARSVSPASAPESQEERVFSRGDPLGRYFILKQIGEGGMGVVYSAIDPELERKVAIKLLRTDASDDTTGRTRLLREAQALARVSHPNVISVFDVGTVGNQVFVAMEYIDGVTLRDWLQQGERSWRDILRIFIEAGQGLVAAHQVGLVHRDFKPANVLIDKRERVYVMDFGLARMVESFEEDEYGDTTQAVMDEQQLQSNILSSPLTQVGLVMGTPHYMPPEQYRGRALDARSDQFSFCASLYRALFDQVPFEPKRMKAVAAALFAADKTTSPLDKRGGSAPSPFEGDPVIREPTNAKRVPKWLRRAILRGLQLDPADRFASMKELLQQLAEGERRARRQWVGAGVGAGAAAVLGVSALAVLGPHDNAVCAGSQQLAAQVWNAELEDKLRTSFATTGQPFAQEAAERVAQALDGYARQWAQVHTEACEATRVRGVQTEELLSLRVVCLERRRKDLGALARLLVRADGKLVERAVDAAAALPSLEECNDIESLANQVGLPTEPALRTQVEQLGEQLADVKALHDAGRFKPAVELARKLEPQVVATAYLPLRAETRYHLGWLQFVTGEREASVRTLEQALQDAETGRADRLKVAALTKLMMVSGLQGQGEQAGLWSRLASASLARIGGEPSLASDLMGNLGNLALKQFRYKEAREYFEKARELQRTLSPEDPKRAKVTYSLGLAALMLGEHERAVKLLEEALRQTQAAKGRLHPEMAIRHATLSRAYRERGDFERALAQARAAVELRKTLFGPEHSSVADALDAVGMVQLGQKHFEDALRSFQEALALKHKALGPQHADLSFSHDGIGQALLGLERPAEAIAPLEQALGFSGIEPDALGESGFALARALWESGRERERARQVAATARERLANAGKKERVAALDAWLASLPGESSSARPVRGTSRARP
jgi:tetratricopeptide (TPR) repeat protein/predicted Ser/Thr protein kinase